MVTAFIGGCPLVPIRAGELNCICLGAAIEAWVDEGRPVTEEAGELVLTQPMPSMPVFFWNDPDGERYRRAYFDKYPGVWCHGDWLTITERGFGCGAWPFGRHPEPDGCADGQRGDLQRGRNPAGDP